MANNFPIAGIGDAGAAAEELGIFFQDDLILTGSETSNKFTFNGDSNVTVTLPLESSVPADYIVFIENQTTKKNRTVSMLTQGGDTIVGSTVIGEGNTLTIVVSATGEFTSSITIGTVTTDDTLSGTGASGDALSVNRAISEREIFVTDAAGDDTFTGMNVQTPVKTFGQAISIASNVIPAPDASRLTSIIDIGTSTYDESVILTGFIDHSLSNSAIVGSISGGVTVTVETDNNTFDLGSIFTHDSTGGTAVVVNNANAFALRVAFIFCRNDNQTGLIFSGTTNNPKVDDAGISCLGLNSIGLHLTHTGDSDNALAFSEISTAGNNSTSIIMDIVGGTPITISVNNLTTDNAATGMKSIDVKNGFITIGANVVIGDIQVDTGATLVLSSETISDVNTINVEGTLHVWIVEGNPTVNIIGAGIIHGYIGGIYYGDAEGGHYSIITADTLLPNNEHKAYVDASAAPIELTLATNPVDGESKVIWVADNTNIITISSESPSFPIAPVTPVAEANVEGQWALSADFLAYEGSHDLTNQGTGGAHVAMTVQGNAVMGFDFEQTAYLEATIDSYKGVLGSSGRTFSTWYRANAGTPTVSEALVVWGEVAGAEGGLWDFYFDATASQLIIHNIGASFRWNFSNLIAVGLFDGNEHHIAMVQSTSNFNSCELLIDNVKVGGFLSDGSPSCNTRADINFRIGANETGGDMLNAALYDVRLWDRGLSSTEITEVYNQDITGSRVISVAPDNTVFEMAYSGTQWEFGDGIALSVQSNTARIETLETRNIEDNPTAETDLSRKLAPDGLGGVEWIVDPLGSTFDADLVLDGSEVANRFIYNGNGVVNITLPPSANVTLDYTIFVENRGAANPVVTILLDGSDTLSGGNGLNAGDLSTVTKTTATNYNSDLVTAATQSTIDALEDGNILLAIATQAIYTGSSVEDALIEVLGRVIVLEDAPSGLGYTLQWGGNMQTIGNYARVSDTTNGGQTGSLTAASEAVVLADGTLDRLSYSMGTGNNTTVLKIWKNGAVAHTFTATGATDVETGIGLSVATGDLIGIEYDAGMKPAGSIYVAYIS